jgi:hypothetical protein
LNTAVEIVEEVTSRNCTNTQDVDYVKCYGIRAMSKEQQEEQQQEQPWWKSPPFDSADGSCVGDYYSGGGCGYCDFAGADITTTSTTGTGAGAECYNNYFDYYENADSVVGDDDAEENVSAAAVSQMLADFESNINSNSNSVSTSAAPAAPVGAYANDEVVVEVEMGAAIMEEEAVTVTVSATAAEAAETGEKGEKEGEKNIKAAAVDEKPKSSSKWYSFLW